MTNNKFYVYNERVSSIEVNWFNNRGYAIYNNRLVKYKSMPNINNCFYYNIIIIVGMLELGRQAPFRPEWFKYHASSSLATYIYI